MSDTVTILIEETIESVAITESEITDDVTIAVTETLEDVTLVVEERYGIDGVTPVKGVNYFDGNDGREVELQTGATHIQWRYVGDIAWTNLIAIADITGTDGKELEIRVDSGYIQTRLEGGSWTNLIAVSSLIGETGRGITSIVRTSGTGAAGTTDTYTITYSDSTTSTFTVYNGADGATQDISGKVDKVTGKGLSTEDYTTVEKNKLSGIADNANNYVHPANHDPSIITQDANNRFVTDTEKGTWNGKTDNSFAIAMALAL